MKFGEKCRLLPDQAIPKSYQGDAFSSSDRNVRERAKNEPASCKTDLRLAENENPGAAATASGVKSSEQAYHQDDYLNRTARAIAALLTAAQDGDSDACKMAIRTLRQLPGFQVATIAAVSMMSLTPETAEEVASAAIEHSGSPIPTFLRPLDDARFWAGCASRAERKAYALASFEAMHAEDRAAFLRHIDPQEVTA